VVNLLHKLDEASESQKLNSSVRRQHDIVKPSFSEALAIFWTRMIWHYLVATKVTNSLSSMEDTPDFSDESMIATVSKSAVAGKGMLGA
jgi:hypothetical protein